jgi:hypothetical protein
VTTFQLRAGDVAMAEGRGIEPLRASLRDLRLAGECITALPAFRVGGAGWIRTTSVSLYRRVHCQLMLPRRKMVGQVGVEPTESPRSERGAFANLTTARWSGRKDSNLHSTASQSVASASWATSGKWWATKDSNLHRTALEAVASASCASGPWRRVRDSNPQRCLPVTVFKTARPACRPTLRNAIQLYEWDWRYERDRKDRLRSEEYETVSRRARITGGSIAQETSDAFPCL